MNAHDLIGEVRQIATQLAAALAAAEAESSNWRQESKAWPLVRGAMDRCLAALEATGCRGEANRLPSGELWKIAGKSLETGWLQTHARTKPRGYAGDFEMFKAICAGQICDDPLGRYFDRFFQNQAAAQAVRNRTNLVAGALADAVEANDTGHFCVTSVGSGPAVDVRRAIERLDHGARDGIEVRLLDLDPAALDFARASLEAVLQPRQVATHRTNLYRLPQQRRISELIGEPHFLFCIGLFDYLDDEEATAMLHALWQALAAGGRLMVFNFSTDNPSRPYMEWIGNWYVIQRDAAQMAKLAEAAALPADAVLTAAEETGVNLFLSAVKPT